MKRNWALLALGVVGMTIFALSRTVWGPPNKAAAEPAQSHAGNTNDADDARDAERRFISNQPRHWRYVMLRRN
jgi:hypothetical protein